MFGIKAMKAALAAQAMEVADLKQKLQEAVDSFAEKVDEQADNIKDELADLERQTERKFDELDTASTEDVIHELSRAGVPTDDREFQNAVDEALESCDALVMMKEQTAGLQENFNHLFSYH